MRKVISISLAALLLSSLNSGSWLHAEESLTGHWKAEFEKADVTRDYFLAIVQKGNELGGSLISTRTRAYPFTTASVEGKRLSIDIERPYKGEEVVFKIRGEIEENGQIRGTLEIGGERIATIRMWRAPDPVGIWNVKSRSLDSDTIYESVLEIRRTPRGYAARFKHEGKELEVLETGWREGRMIFALRFPTDDGEEVPIVMAAEFEDENTIVGEWGIPETDRRSEWSARRVRPVATKPAVEAVTKREEKDVERRQPKPRSVSFAGEWHCTAKVGDGGTVKFVVTIDGKGEERRGEIDGTTPDGIDFKSKLTDLKVDGPRISFRWEFEGDGNVVAIEMAGEVGKDGTLKGVWETNDDEGSWEGRRMMRL